MNVANLKRTAACISFFFVITCSSISRCDEVIAGKQIYSTQCAECHGESGEGVSGVYEEPLTGDLSIQQLTRLIDRTMPDESADECKGEDAAKVARFIHDEFYSEIAQARNSPPRIQFSRITNRQYENAVADLVGSFQPKEENISSERGLKADYYYSRRFRRKDLAFSRTDNVVDFDFGENRPPNPNTPDEQEPTDESTKPAKKKRLTKKEKEEANAFSIQWEGSVVAPTTGEYEFILQTENGAKLYVNDQRKPLIDAWVQSGSMNEHRAVEKLLGGRAYPIRLDCYRFKEKSASIRLLWKTPNGVEEVIPNRFLLPQLHRQK